MSLTIEERKARVNWGELHEDAVDELMFSGRKYQEAVLEVLETAEFDQACDREAEQYDELRDDRV